MNALVVVGNYFPHGVAISSRMVNFCRLFSACKINVHVIALYAKEKDIKVNRVYDLGFCTYQIATAKEAHSLASFIGEMGFIGTLKSYIKKNGRPDFVFVSSVEPYFCRIRKILKDIPIYLEQCEWMDQSSYKFGRFDYRLIRRDALLHRKYKCVNGIVAISRMLEEHYRAFGIKSIRIPAILDVQGTKCALAVDHPKKIIVYTGNPSTSKEVFQPVFEAIQNNHCIRDEMEFHIYGPDEKKVLASIDGDRALLESVRSQVFFHGRVPQETIADILRKADFQLFIRPNRRSSNAGFPTKMAESMAVGTPVVTNETGDIGLYLHDGVNGYIADGIEPAEIEKVLLRVVRQKTEDAASMRRAARKTAEKWFDYREYIMQVHELLKEEHEYQTDIIEVE